MKTAKNTTVLLLFYLLGFFSGCTTTLTDKELGKYKPKFSKEVGIAVDELDKLVLTFNSTKPPFSGGTIGVCHLAQGTIEIDPSYWYLEARDKYSKRALIYHEIAHCLCKIGHDDTMLKDSCPSSLMHSSTTSEKCYEAHWDDYMKDIKKKCDESIAYRILKGF